MRDVYVVSAVRSAIGTFGGSFKEMLPGEVIVPILQEVVNRSGIEPEQVDEVIVGHCLQRTDEPNTARTAALKAGFPNSVTGYTIQRQCASGLQAIISGMQQIQTGNADVVIAGGVEVMSSSPYSLKQYRWGGRLQHGQVTDTVWEILEDPIHHIMMGETAERLADTYGITREEQDQLAFESHQKALAAQESGRFDREIVPIQARIGRNKTIVFNRDEHPRADITLEGLAKLKPTFRKEGTVTAGNASGINDGAAALVLMSGEKVKKLGIQPMARLLASSVSGVEPELMGYGPAPAIQKLMKKTGMNIADIDIWEINEAFAAQYLAVEKLLELDRSKVNLNGSGISLGHPVGCTGARITTTLLHELHHQNKRYGISALCVGGGMGVALLLERV